MGEVGRGTWAVRDFSPPCCSFRLSPCPMWAGGVSRAWEKNQAGIVLPEELRKQRMSRPEPYTIEEHRHREAAWAASRSASASKLCRFRVEAGTAILVASGFSADLARPEQLPTPAAVDGTHQDWRERVIQEAAKMGIMTFTHGVAAKLINCYLKARFVCGGHHHHPSVQSLHPPIDALLLKALAAENIGEFRRDWRRLHEAAWSKFTSEQYQETIDLIRLSIPGRPLWEIEQYWVGHQ